MSAASLATVLETADHILQLESDKNALLKLIESRMSLLAPNLSHLLGTSVAAKLMGIAGGLVPLSKIPACNIQTLGQKKRSTNIGLASKSQDPHQGVVFQCEMVQSTPSAYRVKAARLVATKAAILARVDAHGEDTQGVAGRNMRE